MTSSVQLRSVPIRLRTERMSDPPPPDAVPASQREAAARVAAQLTGNLTALDTTGRDLPAGQSFLVLMVTDLTRQVHRLAHAIGGAP